MKKATSILLAFIFLLSSTGFAINKHFCGNKLQSTDLLIIQSHESCCGVQEMLEDCCKNEIKVVKLKGNFIRTQTVNMPLTDFIAIFVITFVKTFNFSLTESYTVGLYANPHDPPNKSVSRIILFRSILI